MFLLLIAPAMNPPIGLEPKSKCSRTKFLRSLTASAPKTFHFVGVLPRLFTGRTCIQIQSLDNSRLEEHKKKKKSRLTFPICPHRTNPSRFSALHGQPARVGNVSSPVVLVGSSTRIFATGGAKINTRNRFKLLTQP